MIERYDGNVVNYHNSPIVTGPYLRGTTSEVIAATMSHLKAIHDWYTTSTDEIGFFCEDDIKFDMIDLWNFSWNELISSVPTDWKVLQLSVIRSVPFTNNDMKLHMRKWDDWSCRTYVLKRSYAEEILKDYYKDGFFTLNIKNTDHIPLPENIIYTKDHLETYTIPLFTENRKSKVDSMKGENIQFVEKIQNDSYNFITSWWEETGSKLSVDKVLDYNAEFDWGIMDIHHSILINEEIFQNRIYEKYVSVKENDIVLDIGANVGAFTYSILDKNPKKVICLEPSNTLVKTLTKNVARENVDILNVAVGDSTGDGVITDQVVIFSNDGDKFSTVSFKDIVAKYKLDYVDFMKIDCEGGEYSVFTPENSDYILNNIGHIAAEFHVWGFDDVIRKFTSFRDTYLKGHENYVVLDRYGNDVTQNIWDDVYLKNFSDYNQYGALLMVYITNKKRNTPTVKEKIPVIGTAVVNSVSWVSRLLSSVDYPVENFVIINNNGRGELDKELNELVNAPHEYIDNIKVVHMPSNIGCAGAWNLIIKCYMNSPYWIIANDDVAFKPGLLKEMNTLAITDYEFGTIHPNAGDFNIGAWDLFLIHERAIQALGLFDENTYPAYCEDADYIMRMSISGMKKIVGLSNTYLHGTGEAKDYYVHGRQTEKSDEQLKDLLQKANLMNIEYLTRKWGPGWRKVDPQKIPFAPEERDISYSLYDLKFVRQKHTGF
jgi:FkbM family methyltransferase